jgi:chromosome segregation ATPase
LHLQNEYEELLKQVVLVKAYLSEMDLRAFEQAIAVQEKEEREKVGEINATKAELQKQHIQKGKLEQEVKELMKEISINYTKLKNMEQLNNVIDLQTVSELGKEIESLKKYCDHLKFQRSETDKELNQQASNDISKEYLEKYNQWSSQNEAIKKEYNKRKEEYLYTESMLQSKRNIMEEFSIKQTKLADLAKD